MSAKNVLRLATVPALAAVTVLSAGCASGVPFVPLSGPPEGKALVYVYRVSRATGSAGSLWAMVGNQSATLSNGTHVPMILSPGEHSVHCGSTAGLRPLVLRQTDADGVSRKYEFLSLKVVERSLRSMNFTAQANATQYVEIALNCKMHVRTPEEARVIHDTKLGGSFDARSQADWEYEFRRCRGPDAPKDDICITISGAVALVTVDPVAR